MLSSLPSFTCVYEREYVVCALTRQSVRFINKYWQRKEITFTSHAWNILFWNFRQHNDVREFEFGIRYVSNGKPASGILTLNYFIDWMIRWLHNWTCVNKIQIGSALSWIQIYHSSFHLYVAHSILIWQYDISFIAMHWAIDNELMEARATTAPPSTSNQTFYCFDPLAVYENSELNIKISLNAIVRLAFNHRLL